jgi:osomolarity two-component system, response regulator SKN7
MIRQFNRVTPIVAVTSNVKPSHVMTYFTAGMIDVLGKPFSKAEVSDILEVCYNPTFPFSLHPDWVSQ